MRWSNLALKSKAWLITLAVLVVGTVAHFVLLGSTNSPAVSMAVGAAVFVICGGIMAYIFPSRSPFLAASVGIAAAVTFGIGDVMFGELGYYDAWPGPLNSLMTSIIVMPIAAVLATAGAYGAIAIAKVCILFKFFNQ